MAVQILSKCWVNKDAWLSNPDSACPRYIQLQVLATDGVDRIGVDIPFLGDIYSYAEHGANPTSYLTFNSGGWYCQFDVFKALSLGLWSSSLSLDLYNNATFATTTSVHGAYSFVNKVSGALITSASNSYSLLHPAATYPNVTKVGNITIYEDGTVTASAV